jgi:predicted dehydrogenase
MYHDGMSTALRVGLVGLGIHGQRYARHLLDDVAGARLQAVCRSNVRAGEAFARRHSVRFFADWRHLVADPEVEAVAVVTPPSLTPAVVRAALRAGKPVLAEKPLAASGAAGRGLRRVVARTGTALLVAHTMRWDATVVALRSHLDRVGKIRLLAIAQRLDPAKRSWLDSEAGGDVLLNTGVHAFDLLRYLSGAEVEQVWCRARAMGAQNQACSFVAGMALTHDILATVDNCRVTGGRSGRIEVVGEKGVLTADFVQRSLTCQVGQGSEALEVGADVPTVRAVLDDFVRVARGHRPIPVGLEDGLRAVQIALACRRSARLGGTIRLTAEPA